MNHIDQNSYTHNSHLRHSPLRVLAIGRLLTLGLLVAACAGSSLEDSDAASGEDLAKLKEELASPAPAHSGGNTVDCGDPLYLKGCVECGADILRGIECCNPYLPPCNVVNRPSVRPARQSGFGQNPVSRSAAAR